jgi:hypothetical protein
LGVVEELEIGGREWAVGEQTVRQSARLAAGEAHAKQRQARAERERRLHRLAVEVLVAVAERDAAAVRAGTALQAMTAAEGVPLREAVEWCGGQLTVREAARLRQQADVGRPAADVQVDAQDDVQVEPADTIPRGGGS